MKERATNTRKKTPKYQKNKIVKLTIHSIYIRNSYQRSEVVQRVIGHKYKKILKANLMHNQNFIVKEAVDIYEVSFILFSFYI